MKHAITKMVVALIVLALLGGAGGWYVQRSREQTVSFLTAPVTRGDLLISISATGTLEPEEVIDVGAQIAGQILSFGTDVSGKTVDYGSVVEQGTVLASIDDALYQAEVAQAEAQVQSSKASIQRAKADVEQLKAKLRQAERDWKRAEGLRHSNILSEESYDSSESAYETAKANVAVGEAEVLQAEASLVQSEKTLWRAQRNLGYCTITAPVRGVIIDRRVNVGQTVVASLNAPSLFLIAKDLKRMQVWVAVNEADIGRIHPGQDATFTVDAFPGEPFRGKVGKVRLNASMTQNVVTYTVEVVADNSKGRLLPYLTANVRFELDRRKNVLLVPNAALRWTPSVEQVAADCRAAFQESAAQAEKPQGSERTAADGQEGRRTLWVPAGKNVRPLFVQAGLSDDIETEVRGEGLTEGMEVVGGVQTEQTQAGDQTETTNPFTPKIPKREKALGPPPPM